MDLTDFASEKIEAHTWQWCVINPNMHWHTQDRFPLSLSAVALACVWMRMCVKWERERERERERDVSTCTRVYICICVCVCVCVWVWNNATIPPPPSGKKSWVLSRPVMDLKVSYRLHDVQGMCNSIHLQPSTLNVFCFWCVILHTHTQDNAVRAICFLHKVTLTALERTDKYFDYQINHQLLLWRVMKCWWTTIYKQFGGTSFKCTESLL